MSAPRILLAGATGMVGDRVLRRLLDDPAARASVLAPVRRPLSEPAPVRFSACVPSAVRLD